MMQQQPAPPPFPTIRERCVGCRTFLHAAPGVSELPCPQCQMPHAFAGAVDPSAVRLRCPTCKALVNAPSDLSRFPCPQCGVELDVHADGDGVNEVFILRLFFRWLFFFTVRDDFCFSFWPNFEISKTLERMLCRWENSFTLFLVTLIWMVWSWLNWVSEY